jgi:chromatin structure-remodeling complex subunit RSC9
MAPNNVKAEEASIERTSEYEDFINTLAEYHEKRGWVFHLGNAEMSAY